jgi:hypothetical protein
VWLEIAEAQYHGLPDELRVLIDRRLGWLLDDPTSEPDAVYNRRSDQYSANGMAATCARCSACSVCPLGVRSPW